MENQNTEQNEVKRRDSADTAEITVDEAINLAKEI